MNQKIVLSWSGGIHSMLMLYRLLEQGEHDILALITTVLAGESKIVMHEVPQALLEAQACALGFPLYTLEVPRDAANAAYEGKFIGLLQRLKRRNVDSIAFGDIFLEDIRAYRESFLHKIGMQPLFPLWNIDSRALAGEFMELGFKGITVCVDSRALDASFAGREMDSEFFKALPAGVDPCGENGEFHSFVYDGPLFKDRLRFTKGEVMQRGAFYYCDLTVQ